jgi:valyl-tRNA synthetase
MKLKPDQRVPLVAEGDAAQLNDCAPYMAALAKLSEVRIVDALPAADAPVSLAGGFKLMLEVHIDKDAERARLEKERARIAAEIAKAQGNLGNPKFVGKAPPQVVEQMRERLAKFEVELKEISAQLSKLAAEA